MCALAGQKRTEKLVGLLAACHLVLYYPHWSQEVSITLFEKTESSHWHFQLWFRFSIPEFTSLDITRLRCHYHELICFMSTGWSVLTTHWFRQQWPGWASWVRVSLSNCNLLWFLPRGVLAGCTCLQHWAAGWSPGINASWKWLGRPCNEIGESQPRAWQVVCLQIILMVRQVGFQWYVT